MKSVSMFEAKTNLSKYVASLLSGENSSIIISRSGKPVAKLVPYAEENEKRIGIAKGKLPMLCDLEDFNEILPEDDFVGGGGLL